MSRVFQKLIVISSLFVASCTIADETITLATGVDTATMLVKTRPQAPIGTQGGGGSFPVFTAADFTSASTGPPAILVNSSFPTGSGNWIPSLTINPAAKWVSNIDDRTMQSSVLYAFPFNVTETNIISAFITVHYSVDNFLGDFDGTINGPNEPIYINGMPVGAAEILGGGNQEYQTARIDITNFVNTGSNTLYLYNLNNIDFGQWSGLLAHSVIEVQSIPKSIPVLNFWGLLLLSTLLGLHGVIRIKLSNKKLA